MRTIMTVETREIPRLDNPPTLHQGSPQLTPWQRLRRERTPRERSPHREVRHKTKTPPAPQPPSKEDPGVHSGSEEGEIEED